MYEIWQQVVGLWGVFCGLPGVLQAGAGVLGTKLVTGSWLGLPLWRGLWGALRWSWARRPRRRSQPGVRLESLEADLRGRVSDCFKGLAVAKSELQRCCGELSTGLKTCLDQDKDLDERLEKLEETQKESSLVGVPSQLQIADLRGHLLGLEAKYGGLLSRVSAVEGAREGLERAAKWVSEHDVGSLVRCLENAEARILQLADELHFEKEARQVLEKRVGKVLKGLEEKTEFADQRVSNLVGKLEASESNFRAHWDRIQSAERRLSVLESKVGPEEGTFTWSGKGTGDNS